MFKHLKFLLGMSAVLLLLQIYSCTQENSQIDTTNAENGVVEYRSSGLCIDTNTGCNQPYIPVTLLISERTSNYPNCEFWINVEYRICNNQVDMVYVGFGAPIPLDPDCNQFDIDTSNPLIVEQVLQEVQQELIAAAAIRLALEANPGGLPPICGMQSAMVLNLFQSACSKFCLIKNSEGKFGSGYSVISLNCGNSCCQSTNEICIDLSTGEVKITEVSSSVPVSPCTVDPAQLPCPRSSVWSSECRPRCASIGQGG